MKVNVLSDIETLLYHHDEVEIPSLGVISTRQNDFTIDRGKGEIYPSAKRVHTFDRIIHTNNNTLVNFIAHKYGMSYEEARQAVHDFAETYAKELQNKGLHIPSIGKLMIDGNERIVFEPNAVRNFSVENYGLPTLKNAQPVALARETIKEETKALTTREIPLPAKSYSQIFVENRLLQLMVIIVLLLGTTIPLTQRYLNNNNSTASFNPIPSVENTDNDNQNNYDSQLSDDEGYVQKKKNEPITETTETSDKGIEKTKIEKTEKPKEVKPTQPVASKERHLIVIGAFGSRDNVRKLEKEVKAKGFSGTDVTKLSNGLYRVAIILNCSKREVPAQLASIKKDYKNAWWKK